MQAYSNPKREKGTQTILFWTRQNNAECDTPDCILKAYYQWDEGSATTNLCAGHNFDVRNNARSLAQVLLVLEVAA